MLRRFALAFSVLILLSSAGKEACALPRAADIQDLLSANSSAVIDGFALDTSDLSNFYKARDYKAVWNFSGPSNEAALATFLDSAEQMVAWHGLRREDYPFDAMRKLAASQDEASHLKLEVMVMDTLLQLARNLHGDTVDLDDLYPGWTFRRQPLDIPAKLAEASNSKGLGGFLESLIPAQPSYHALASALAAYRKIAERGGWRPIAPGPTLRPGDKGPRVAQLRARLAAEEELTFPADTALQQSSSGPAKSGEGAPDASGQTNATGSQRVGQIPQNRLTTFASTGSMAGEDSHPLLKLPTANKSFLMIQFSRVFERLAPLDVAPIGNDQAQAGAPALPLAMPRHASFAGQPATPAADSSSLSFGGLSLDAEYPGSSTIPYRSTPLQSSSGENPSSDEQANSPDPQAAEPAQNQQPSPATSSALQPPGSPAPAADAAPQPEQAKSPVDPAIFDDGLQEALQRWQIRNGLDADGNVGPKTLEMLNVPVSDRIRQIRANMERWRHMPEDFPPERYAHVNIADANLSIIESGKIAYFGPVVVGRVDRKTPFIQSNIRSMIVNPSWHVPAKIARKDILPKLRRDPHYLEKLGFVISGNEEDPHGANIDWESLKEREFNFHLRQSPGDANSLGRIKFDFDNNFAVYMHGTPHQELFGKDRRNFSSGCIRLRDPVDVAEVIMSANAGHWDEQKLNDTIQSGKTRWVAVAKPLPLFIVYETVFVGFDGKLQFRKDVYNYDKFLMETMESKAM